jgi:hypothetical protein
MVIVTTPKKRWFLETPLKMFSSSGLRELNSLNTWHKTNVLNITVFFTLLECSNVSWVKCKRFRPLKLRVRRTATWKTACGYTNVGIWINKFLHMILVTRGSLHQIHMNFSHLSMYNNFVNKQLWKEMAGSFSLT